MFDSVDIPLNYGLGHVFDHNEENGIGAQNHFQIRRPVRQYHIQNFSSYFKSLACKNLTRPSHVVMNATSHFVFVVGLK